MHLIYMMWKTWYCHIKQQQFDYTGALLELGLFLFGSKTSWESKGSGLSTGSLVGAFCF